jgi:hypothetical protein
MIWDGAQSLNISSPADPERTSIQTLVRSGLEPSRRGEISLALHRAKNQFWFSCSSVDSTYNDTILVFNWDQGVWSRYVMDVDYVVSMEDENDDPWIYGFHQGYLVKMDDGTFDGTSRTEAQVAGIVTSGTTTVITATAMASTANEFKGLWVSYYHATQNVVSRRRIASNTPTTYTLYTALPYTPVAGDTFIIGSFDYYLDFNLNQADPATLKKMVYFLARLTASSTGYLRLNVQANKLGRTYDPTEGTNYVRTVGTDTHTLRINLGGHGGNFRIRLGDTSANSEDSAPWLPSLSANIEFHHLEIESKVLSGRLS